jgi:protein-S-isoprenylcysteine O-methyltransferase Ste14
MVNQQIPSNPSMRPGTQWPITLATLAVGMAFFSLWFWVSPGWLGFRVETAGASSWRWLAAIPSVLGFAVALRCVWGFGRTGHGTPAPIAPPQQLVVVGFYRYVRNPMYVGFAVGWIGLWIVFGHANRAAIVVAAVALGVHLFVVFYEEPSLRKKFGDAIPSIVAMYAVGSRAGTHGTASGNAASQAETRAQSVPKLERIGMMLRLDRCTRGAGWRTPTLSNSPISLC